MKLRLLGNFWVITLAAAVFAASGVAQTPKKSSEASERTVEGIVQDSAGQSVVGAIVQLKNTRTQQIRSFIAKDDGAYFFNGLSSEIDYELRADANGASSPTKTLSSYDGRKKAVLNLKLNK